jgi:hypothetical protein
MRVIQGGKDAAARFITAGMEVELATTISGRSDMSIDQLREAAETVLVTLKLARRESEAPALVVDALVARSCPISRTASRTTRWKGTGSSRTRSPWPP